MDKLIPEMYRSYGKYVNAFRSFPLSIDGLKPVERRVLLTTFLKARTSLTKCARVDGTCIAQFHPHGSSYGTIVQMVRQGFLIGQGNFGNNLGVEPSPPAAMRYTECQIKPSTVEMMFKYIKDVPWVESELDDEPLYIPTMFPVSLMGTEYTQGIGFGYRTYIPCFEVSDLYKRLMWLNGERKTKPLIKPITDCKILSSDKELEELTTTGKQAISLQGIFKEDKKNCKLYINSWPPGKRFEGILSKFKLELDAGDIGFIDLSNKASGTNIECSVLKQRNRDRIYTTFIKKLKVVLTGNVSFETNVVDLNGNVQLQSIDTMLKSTYDMFERINEVMLGRKIQEADDHITENKFIEKIRPHLIDALKSGEKDADKLIEVIAKKSKESEKIIRLIFGKYRISKLLSVDTDMAELEGQKKIHSDNLKNLKTFVLDQYGTTK